MRLDMITRGINLMFSGFTATPRHATHGNLPYDAAGTEPQLVSRLMLTATTGVSVLLIWASFAKLDDIARAGGLLVAHGNNAVVQHRDGGILEQIYVREGQTVQAGQPLLKLNDVDIEADAATIRQRMDFLRAQVRRLGYVLGLPQAVPAYIGTNLTELTATDILQTSISTISETTTSPTVASHPMLLPPPDAASADPITTATSTSGSPVIAALAAALKASTDSSSNVFDVEPAAGADPTDDPQAVALMERRQTLRSGLTLSQDEYRRQSSLRQQGFGTQSRVYAAERDMQSQSQSLAAFEADLASQYATAISEYTQQDEQLKKLKSRASNTIVRAPISGIVQGLRLNTDGATVPAGATLMELVPSNAPLEALLRLSPNHIGMVRVGQHANLRITAFEASHYGTLEGTVTRISADATADAEGHPTYQVWVGIPQTLQGARGSQALKPGMVLVAAVVTGRHTILDYLLRPIRNALDDLSPQSPSKS